MLDTATEMNSDRSKNDYSAPSTEMEHFLPWSPLEENKYSVKHRYVSCSRSVPHRNHKRFIKYKISRSLNFDGNTSGSTSNFLEEDKYFSRSAKIMRALNFSSSPTYYGKTKTKRSLNFNLTPSPKRFVSGKKGIRKALSLTFSSPKSMPNKILDSEDSPNNSVNSSLICTSSESIDENQNETPSRQNAKEYTALHYSTPNTELDKKSLTLTENYTPVLRSRLKKTTDNIIYIAATPSSKSTKCKRNKSKHTGTITSRSLLFEFDEKDDGRPCTPENVIRIVPESMSAIKRSHKKERLSRQKERCAKDFANVSTRSVTGRRSLKNVDPVRDLDLDAEYSSRVSETKRTPLRNSEDDISDTGSLFDYSEVRENIFEKSEKVLGCMTDSDDNVPSTILDVKIKPKENMESFSDVEALNESNVRIECGNVNDSHEESTENVVAKADVGAVTPEPRENAVLVDSKKIVTPENSITLLESVARESIKKSHKKKKDDVKGKLLTPKMLQREFEIADQEDVVGCWQTPEQDEKFRKRNELTSGQSNPDYASEEERASTPDKINSSRLLLSQFSSVKKSHKKDKHKKILSGFLKRQEYFNREYNADDATACKNSVEDVSSEFESITSVISPPVITVNDNTTSIDELSPSKRKKLLNTSLVDHDTSASADSELQECDSSKEDFQIFTPLKRKRSLRRKASSITECPLHFYTLPSGKDEIFKEDIACINQSRCLTPVSIFKDILVKSEENDFTTGNSLNEIDIEIESAEMRDCKANGRSTPRDMSTAELYLNLDSIKKSHKKNKRDNSSRVGLIRTNNMYVERKSDDDWSEEEKEALDKLGISSDSMVDTEASPDQRSNETSSLNINTENASTSVTPPNCLTAKNYIRLLRETSIKRSHKKIRKQRKQEYTDEANELSDDGSIFGNEEKLSVQE